MRAILWALALIAVTAGAIRGISGHGHITEAAFWLSMGAALMGWAVGEGERSALKRKDLDR